MSSILERLKYDTEWFKNYSARPYKTVGPKMYPTYYYVHV